MGKCQGPGEGSWEDGGEVAAIAPGSPSGAAAGGGSTWEQGRELAARIQAAEELAEADAAVAKGALKLGMGFMMRGGEFLCAQHTSAVGSEHVMAMQFIS